MTTASPGEGTASPASSSGRSLPQAVATALVLLGLIILFNLIGPDGFFFLAAVVIGMGLFEALTALRTSGRRVHVLLGLAFGLALFTVTGPLVDEPAAILGVLIVGGYLTFLAGLLPGRGETPASDVAWTIATVVWVGGGGAGATYLLTLSDAGALILTSFVLVTALNDIGGYFVGTRFGSRRIAPSISPKKSWEGWAGGLVASIIGGAGFGAVMSDLTVIQGIGMAAIASVLAPIGDLSVSLFKRELGLKDMGSLLPGHGGMLDRIDGIVFAAPAVAVYLRYVVFGG